ncbi:glycine-rich RNA-binding protein RZ1C-like [Camellia sinensis]|uniref:glycine-rich RNA-binding protein RZ1C-like n=1 Tax=Camellia sinensis TaxID=4442 RepID=UPI0010369BCF|nr:glycine-rich RNA-binding protein RZ1C-like [Camellia sinensis]
MVNNEYRKARKFESGLRGPIQDQVNLLNMLTYAGVLDKAILAETNLNRSQSLGKNQRKRHTYDNREEEADLNDAEEKTKEDSPNNVNQEGGTWPTCASCGKRHLGACHRTTGACFGCGEIGHRIKDCPKVKAKDDKKR